MKPAQIGTELKTGSASHEGMSGKHNEDFLGIFPWQLDEKKVFYVGVVADGVGGQTAGEVASHTAVDAVQRYFEGLPGVTDVNKHLEEAILAANEAVYYASQQNPEYAGMSTTMAIVGILDGRFYSAHVGDSRIYLMRDGRLRQISVDHTWAQEAIEAGLLSPDEAKTHPNRNVIRRHLGGQLEVEVDHRLMLERSLSNEQALASQGTSLQAGDTLLICSDGLTDMITDASVQETLHRHFFDLETASQELIDKANRAGGRDNITVVLLQIPSSKAPAAVAAGAVSTTGAAARPRPVTTPQTSPMKAPAAVVAPVAVPTQPQVVAQPKKSRAPLLLILGIVVIMLIGAGIVTAVVIGGSLGDGSDPSPTAGAAGGQAQSTLPPGAPATAAILATLGTSDAFDSLTPVDTPGLIPTLRLTSSATPRRVTRPTNTPARTALPTNTPTSDTTGPGSGGGGPAPAPTNTPAPAATNTSAPAATNTSAPPPTDTPVPVPTKPPPPDTPEPPPATDEPAITEPPLAD